MVDAVTDTHALIWYLEDDPRLGANASKIFDACDRGEGLIYIPTIYLWKSYILSSSEAC